MLRKHSITTKRITNTLPSFVMIAIITYLLPTFACANENQETKPWSFSAALVYSSQSVYRGALVSTGSSIVPEFLVSYKDFLRFDPTSIQFYKIHHKLEYGAGFDRFAADGSPLRFKPGPNNFRSARKLSVNFNAYVTWEPITSLLVTTIISKGIIQNFGYYSYSSILLPATPFLLIGAGYGLGDKRNNAYVFGNGAIGGAGHYDFLGEVNFPLQLIKEKWKRAQLLFTYQQVRIAQAKNRTSSFVLPDDHPKIFGAVLSLDF